MTNEELAALAEEQAALDAGYDPDGCPDESRVEAAWEARFDR